MRERLVRVLAVILMLGGVALLGYPWISNKLADYYMGQALSGYQSTVAQMDNQQMAAEIEAVIIYDDNLIGQPVHDPFDPDAGYVLPSDYQKVLNVNGDGVMGSITIPKISVDLPIYHGVSEDVLEQGVGHIEYTSTPYGGEGRHSWLSAHRGLPNALLFTDLDQLVVRDSFFIHILGEVHAYRVTTIETVTPDGLRSFRPTPGKDQIMLVTCTPLRGQYSPAVGDRRTLPLHARRCRHRRSEYRTWQNANLVLGHVYSRRCRGRVRRRFCCVQTSPTSPCGSACRSVAGNVNKQPHVRAAHICHPAHCDASFY